MSKIHISINLNILLQKWQQTKLIIQTSYYVHDSDCDYEEVVMLEVDFPMAEPNSDIDCR